MASIYKVDSKALIGLDLVAITYMRVEPGRLQEFERKLHGDMISRLRTLHYHPDEDRFYTTRKAGCEGSVLPFLFMTTTGAYDYVLIYAATSSFVVTQFCAGVLRARGNAVWTTSKKRPCVKGFGQLVVDTHTTVAVDNNPRQSIVLQLQRMLGR